jgi:hypothetical protein
MRKSFTILSLLGASLMIIINGLFQESLTNSGGGFGTNVSNAPGTQNCTSCHSGTVNSGPGSVSIATNIPQNGFTPGETYEVTVTINSGGTGGNRYGFACSAVNSNNQQVGGFISINNTTQLRLSGQMISHTSTGNAGGSPTKTFTFNWTAPQQSGGTVTFFASGMSANGNNTTSGDQVYTTNTPVIEFAGASVDVKIINESFNVFPNPAIDFVNINIISNSQWTSTNVQLMDMTGKTILQRVFPNSENLVLDFNPSVKSGLYFLKVEYGNQTVTRKILVERK